MSMDSIETARAWIELDRSALRHNVSLLQDRLPRGCRLMPVLKADAYGHGARLMATELQALGFSNFAVASAAEGAELRRLGIKGDILILGYTHPSQAELLSRLELSQCLVDPDYARELDSRGFPLRAELAIDSGMKRLGTDWQDLRSMEEICRLRHLRVTGAFSHLCTDDEAFSALQSRRFFSAVERLRAGGLSIPRAHILSSCSIFDSPGLGGDFARSGIALCGLLSSAGDEERRHTGLRPVLSLWARVASLRELDAGQGAGYGLCFRPGERRRIAAISIGYGDGLPSALGLGRGRALINGRSAPIVGRICMDQALLDVTGLELRPGDRALLIGPGISAYEMAEKSGTITNEILSRLGPRLCRTWKPESPGNGGLS